jgi:hypothetical protein
MAGVREALGCQAPSNVMALLSEAFKKMTGSDMGNESSLRLRGEGQEPDMAAQVLGMWKRFTGRLFSPAVQGGLDSLTKELMPQWSAVWVFDGVAIQAVTVGSEGDAEKLYDRMEFHVVKGRQKLGEVPGVIEE